MPHYRRFQGIILYNPSKRDFCIFFVEIYFRQVTVRSWSKVTNKLMGSVRCLAERD